MSEIDTKTNAATCPFFIVGCGRSGTTLLKTIISAHPDMFVMPETFFFSNIYEKAEAIPNEPWKAAKGWWLADVGISPTTIRADVEAFQARGLTGAAALLHAIFAFHSKQQSNVQSIGEKTPNHVNYLYEIREIFPNARIIQIIRDPRAVLASYRKVKVGSSAVADVATEWARAHEVLRNAQDSKDYVAIKYEDLVQDPEATLRSVFETLGVEYLPEVLEFHHRKTDGFAQEQAHHGNTRRSLFADSLESWQNELSRNDIALLEWRLAAQMEQVGYATSQSAPRFASLRLLLSRWGGKMHRYFIRVPRQRMKAMRARRRLHRASKSE